MLENSINASCTILSEMQITKATFQHIFYILTYTLVNDLTPGSLTVLQTSALWEYACECANDEQPQYEPYCHFDVTASLPLQNSCMNVELQAIDTLIPLRSKL